MSLPRELSTVKKRVLLFLPLWGVQINVAYTKSLCPSEFLVHNFILFGYSLLLPYTRDIFSVFPYACISSSCLEPGLPAHIHKSSI